MKAVKISENLFWVGAVDFKNGASYNSYLIIDRYISLIDIVPLEFAGEMFKRISDVLDPSKIDLLILNDFQNPCSTAVQELLRIAPDLKIYSANGGAEVLKAVIKTRNCVPVGQGDVLNTGKYNLSFSECPAAHSPYNMLTYLDEEKVLFSGSLFSQGIASFGRFDGEAGIDSVLRAAKKHYANSLLQCSSQADKAVRGFSDVKIKIIAPSFGVMIKDGVRAVTELYKTLCVGETENKAVIVYDSYSGNTEKTARLLCDIFLNEGTKVNIFNLKNTALSDIITEIAECEILCVGSPTVSGGITPLTAGFLTYLKGLINSSKKFIAFSSYGWSGQGADIIHDELQKMKLVPVCRPLSIRYKPDEIHFQMNMNRTLFK